MLKYSDKIPAKSATDNFDMKNISSNAEQHLEISHSTLKTGIFTKMDICTKSWSLFILKNEMKTLLRFFRISLFIPILSWLELICMKFINDLTNRRITWIEKENFLPLAAVISIKLVAGQWDIVDWKMIWQQTIEISLSLSSLNYQVSLSSLVSISRPGGVWSFSILRPKQCLSAILLEITSDLIL